MFEQLKAEYDAEIAGIFFRIFTCVHDYISLSKSVDSKNDFFVAARAAENKPLKVTLPDGKQVDGVAWKTTPYQIAASIRYTLQVEVFNTLSCQTFSPNHLVTFAGIRICAMRLFIFLIPTQVRNQE
jgi:hypothetical protein